MSGDNGQGRPPDAPKVTAAQILLRLDMFDKVLERLDHLDQAVGSLQKKVGVLHLQGRDRVIVARLLAAKYELGEALRLIETPRAPAPAPPAELRLPLGATMREIEREAILQVLAAEQGNRSRTAERLNISRRTVGYWLAKALAKGADGPEAPNKPPPAPGDEEDGPVEPAMSGT